MRAKLTADRIKDGIFIVKQTHNPLCLEKADTCLEWQTQSIGHTIPK